MRPHERGSHGANSADGAEDPQVFLDKSRDYLDGVYRSIESGKLGPAVRYFINRLRRYDMEIGDYATNVLSINDLTLIPYCYLEFSITPQLEQTTLLEIEIAWRKSGVLVFRSKTGIWTFGKSPEQESALPPTATIEHEGLVKFQQKTFIIKQQGTLDPNNVWKASRATTASGPAPTSATPPSSAENNIRSLQSINAKATCNNASIGLSKENGTESSPVKTDSTVTEPFPDARDIQEYFISAILATLRYHLCHDNGFVALNARTLLLPPQDYLKPSSEGLEALYQQRIWVITLDAHLTSLGTLLVKAWQNMPFDLSWTLSPKTPIFSKSLVNGTTLFLAPNGKIGRYCGRSLPDISQKTVDVANTQLETCSEGSAFHEHSMMRWKNHCLSWLSRHGMDADALDSGGWLLVQVRSLQDTKEPIDPSEDGLWNNEEKLVTIAWPTLLCFKRITSTMSDISIPRSRGHDPLSFAEGWFTARGTRDATITKRHKERESTAAAITAQAEIDARNLAFSNFSPAGLRRASIVGAVYPTPPDGIQPGIGATPSFDGSGSTPGPANPVNIAAEPENTIIAKGEVEEVDSNLWDSGDSKREQIISSALDFDDNENENLFGEVGADLFGDNDITDADFNFFDVPDPVAGMEDNFMNDENAFQDYKEDPHEYGAIGDTGTENVKIGFGTDIMMTEVSHEYNTENDKIDFFRDQDTQMLELSSAEHISEESSMHPTENKSFSPPLSPWQIFEKLSTTGIISQNQKWSKSLSQAVGSFGGVPFNLNLSSFNRKYGANGRFTYPSVPRSSGPHSSKNLPKTGYLSKIKKRKPTVGKILNQAFLSNQEALVSELESANERSDAESLDFSQPASPISDQDDTSTSTEAVPFVSSNGSNRKCDSNNAGADNQMSPSFQEPQADQIQFLEATDPLDLLDQSFLEVDPADWSLADFMSSPEPRSLTGILSDSEYIAAAQVLADQAISQTLKIPLLPDNILNHQPDSSMDENGIKNLVQQKLLQATKSCFDRAKECTMAAYLDTQDLQQNGPGNRIPPRPTPIARSLHSSELAKNNSTFVLQAPHLEVQRSESKLTVLPPAVPFWENLGLAPCKGGKDVSAICIYPDGEGLSESVDAFLEQIRSAYESSRLGSHDRFAHADVAGGHVPMDFGDSTLLSVADHQAILSKIKETSTKVGVLLATGPVSEANLVIYYIYEPESPELLVPICSAFHDLFEVYKESLADEKMPVSNELVFQLVPMSFIASSKLLVVPTPNEYTMLAMEVYDRCVDLNSGTSVPSIILEQPLPRAIDFKLAPNPSASPLQENSCMHVAYTQSLDDRWVTAAWTDNTGIQQMTASYCLGRRNSPLTTSFSTIAREIWETTLGIIAVQKVNWRILIAKSGVMDALEIELWQLLASEAHQAMATKESSSQINLTLIAVDTNPSLTLLPPSISVAPNVLATQSSIYTTPVSTPQPSIFSPEPGSVSTPSRDAGPTNATTPNDTSVELKIDADATIIDITDQTWGAILSHSLNNSRSLLELNPTLISGYLVKRSGATASDGPIVIEVNIVHSEVFPRLYDPLLREILGLYRGLATLARVRGCVDPVKDGRPWHIAAVEKGVNALYMLM